MSRQRTLAALLTISMAGIAAWQGSEGFSTKPYIPTAGDVPTIGHGSTRYEDGTAVKLTDKPITKARAEQLARNLLDQDEKLFRESIKGVALFQEEYDLYIDFVGQYGIGNWRKSSMRRALIAKDYPAACRALLKWRYQNGRDCSLPVNWGPKGCKGVWIRQSKRHTQCVAAQE